MPAPQRNGSDEPDGPIGPLGLLREVVRHDGARERFDPSRLADSIHRAAVAVGHGELLLAEELAALVALVLEEEHAGAARTTRAVRETAERVLMETGHHEVARSYILLHARERTTPRSHSAADRSSVVAVRVASLGDERLERFDAHRITSSLMLEGGLASGEASAIAAAVELAVSALGEPIVSAATMRQLIAVELLRRGHSSLLGRLSGLGIPAHEIEAIAFARAGTDSPAARLGSELLRRFALARVLDAPIATAHLNGDLHVDGLGAPGQVLSATLDLAEVRRASMPGALASLVELVLALEPALAGPLAIHHVERVLAPALEDEEHADLAARTLLLALAEGAAPRRGNSPPCRILGIGADLPPAVAAALFRRGGDPSLVRLRLQAFVRKLLEHAVLLSAKLRLPKLRLLIAAGEEERELQPIARALQPALALGIAEIEHASLARTTVRVVGARVAINVARLGLAAGRRNERALLQSARDAVELALSAGANVLRHLFERDELGSGFLRRLRDATRDVARDLPFELPGSHGYQVAIVPVGIDAAVRAVTERDPAEDERAARLKNELLARLRDALPHDELASTRFELAPARFAEAESRFGRLDWLAFPRGRDVLGFEHDGAAFHYSFDPAPDGLALAAVADVPGFTPRPAPGLAAS